MGNLRSSSFRGFLIFSTVLLSTVQLSIRPSGESAPAVFCSASFGYFGQFRRAGSRKATQLTLCLKTKLAAKLAFQACFVENTIWPKPLCAL
jgi:hypothetical protein